MTSANQTTNDHRTILSALWTVALFNYLYADLISMIFNAEAMMRIAMRMTEGVILGWTVFMETAIAMIFLSRVLTYRLNRWANIVAGVMHTAAVVWTLLGGVSRAYYVFLAAVEIACTVFIVWYAWQWKPQVTPTSATGPSGAAMRPAV